MEFNPEIFRAYDIRGIYGQDFDGDFAFRLGAVLVRYFNRKRFLVANDSRGFSGRLAEELMRGISSAGGDVEYLGLSTTPFFNFVFYELGVNGGVMITASHNGPEYGGFKIFGESGTPIGIDSGLEVIKDLVLTKAEASKYGGRVSELDRPRFLKEYCDFIIKESGVGKGELKETRVKVEGGGAVMGIVKRVFVGLEIENRESDSDIVFSFDGDADRLMVADGADNKIRSDFIVALLAENEMGFWSKPKVAHDSRFSRGVIEKLDEWGIKHFKSKAGRTFIREEMLKRKADLAGELSGHIFFKENHFKESPLSALLKVLKIMNDSGKGIDALTEQFRTWFNSGEINTEVADKQREMTQITRLVKEKYPDGRQDTLDGITVEYADWWFNVRASNTEPIIRLVVEAKTKDLLEQEINELTKLIGRS